AVVVTRGIAFRQVEAEEPQPDGSKYQDDPHVWFAVPNAIKMVENIRDALIGVDPVGEATYRANAEAYSAQLEELDRWIFDQIARIPPHRRKLVTNHDAFGYYCDRYGLTFVGSIIPSTDDSAEASAADIARIVLLVRQQGVPAIFAEASTNPLLA